MTCKDCIHYNVCVIVEIKPDDEDYFTEFGCEDFMQIVKCKDCEALQKCKIGQYLGLGGYCSNGAKMDGDKLSPTEKKVE